MARSNTDAGVLGDVCHVRHGGNRRPDGDCTTRADRQRLQGRQHPGIHSRTDIAGAHFRAVHRPRAERLLPALLRLGIGQYRAREHDVHRLPAGGHRHLRAAIVCS